MKNSMEILINQENKEEAEHNMLNEKVPRAFMEPGTANINAGYADNEKYCQELQICLSIHDWKKFVTQPFYQELIEYLGSLQIRGNIKYLDLDKEKLEKEQC